MRTAGSLDLETATPPIKPNKYKPYIIAFGAFCTLLVVPWYGVWGSYVPYLASSFTAKNVNLQKHMNDPKLIEDEYNHYSDIMSWAYSVWTVIYSSTMVLGGQIEHKYGPKLLLITGSLMLCSGLCSCYFVMEYSSNPYLLFVSYGLICGLGSGLLFTTPYLIGMRWFENSSQKGVISGLIMSGVPCSSIIFNLLVTQFINPNNVKIDSNIGFVNQKSVLNNVSYSFLQFALLCFVLCLIGIITLENPPNYRKNNANKKSKKRRKSTRKYSVFSDFEMQIADAMGIGNEHKQHETSLLHTNGNKNDDELDIKLLLCEWRFWNLFLSLAVLPITYVYSQWKEFNNKFLGIENDQILSIMASSSAVCDTLCRPFWGYLFEKLNSMNRNGYKITMGIVAFGLVLFIGTWTQLKHLSDTPLVVCAFIWMNVLYSLTSATVMIIPIYVAHIYGTEKGGIVYGLTYIARAFGTVFSMTVVVEMRQIVGWFYMNNVWLFTQVILLLLVLASDKKLNKLVRCRCS